nr:MAG TPA: hypothetical protein [Caudoviricetes sp.]
MIHLGFSLGSLMIHLGFKNDSFYLSDCFTIKLSSQSQL